MAGGGSTYRRGGRKPGTPNKPKGETALVKLGEAEKEVRVLILAGDKIGKPGKDRLAELDEWAYRMAQKFAPKEDEKGKAYWDGEGDAALAQAGRCRLR